MLQNKNRVYTLFVAGDWVKSNFTHILSFCRSISLLAWWHTLMSSLSLLPRCSAHWPKPSVCLRPWCWGETAEVSPLLSITVAIDSRERHAITLKSDGDRMASWPLNDIFTWSLTERRARIDALLLKHFLLCSCLCLRCFLGFVCLFF